jgi:hypothetical protein
MPGPHASRTGVTMSSGCWMDATGMACVDEATANAKAMGISLVIPRSSQKQGCDFAQYLKPIELDVPLDKGLVRISHHLAPISLGSGLRQQAQESARAGGCTRALSLAARFPVETDEGQKKLSARHARRRRSLLRRSFV